MLTSFDQNWHTTHRPFSLALANTVSTGVSFDTPSGAIRNSQIWARAGFRGLGPVLTFPGGAGLDGIGCGCGCAGGCSGGMGQGQVSGSTEWILFGLFAAAFLATYLWPRRARE